MLEIQRIQTLTQTPANVQKDPANIVEVVAFTGVDTVFDGQSVRQTDGRRH